MTKHLGFKDFFLKLTKLTPIKNQAELARELGVGRAAISIAKQKNTVPIKWIVDICSKYNLNPVYFFGSHGDPYIKGGENEKKISIEPINFENSNLDTTLIEIKGDFLKKNVDQYFYYEIFDNSMEPTFFKGDILFVEQREDLKIGEIGIFKYHLKDKEAILVRRIVAGEKGLILIGDNVTYPHLLYEKRSFKYMGKVIGFFRKI